jgi:hypothetical protein
MFAYSSYLMGQKSRTLIMAITLFIICMISSKIKCNIIHHHCVINSFEGCVPVVVFFSSLILISLLWFKRKRMIDMKSLTCKLHTNLSLSMHYKHRSVDNSSSMESLDSLEKLHRKRVIFNMYICLSNGMINLIRPCNVKLIQTLWYFKFYSLSKHIRECFIILQMSFYYFWI